MTTFFNSDCQEEVTEPEPDWAEEVFSLAITPPPDNPYFAKRLIEMLKIGKDTYFQVRAKMQIRGDPTLFKQFCQAFDIYFIAIQEN